jgi:hypothetical protein
VQRLWPFRTCALNPVHCSRFQEYKLWRSMRSYERRDCTVQLMGPYGPHLQHEYITEMMQAPIAELIP